MSIGESRAEEKHRWCFMEYISHELVGCAPTGKLEAPANSRGDLEFHQKLPDREAPLVWLERVDELTREAFWCPCWSLA